MKVGYSEGREIRYSRACTPFGCVCAAGLIYFFSVIRIAMHTREVYSISTDISFKASTTVAMHKEKKKTKKLSVAQKRIQLIISNKAGFLGDIFSLRIKF